MKRYFLTLFIFLSFLSWSLFVRSSNAAAPGDLDPTFDGDGIALTHIGWAGAAGTEVVVQPDGKIVTVGGVWYDMNNPQNHELFVARHNSDGSFDTTFNGDGLFSSALTPEQDVAMAVTLQPDGKIIAAGHSDNRFTLVRLDSIGQLDANFGDGGVVFTTVGDSFGEFSAVAIQPDGKIVATGDVTENGVNDLATLRYNSDGSLDNSFGNGGVVITDTGSSGETASGLIIQPDGKIVIVGQSGCAIVTIRYNSDGSLDTGFGKWDSYRYRGH